MEWGSKSARLYEEIRQSLQSGCYVPGTRLDATALAKRFHASTTPVRHALYRLVGDGLVEDRARDGFFVPSVSELFLRDLYDWLQHLLVIACGDAASSRSTSRPPLSTEHHDDVVSLTGELFEAIALAAGGLSLIDAIRRANARLGAIRRTEIQLLDDAQDELAHLQRLWGDREMQSLKAGLDDYHERRKQLVPCLVARLGGSSSKHMH